MSVIMIRCPETGSEISTGIECEDDDFKKLPFVITQTACPSCGREHSWSKSDAWLIQDQHAQAIPEGVAIRELAVRSG
ncbi:MAG: hypothetical protein J0H17_11215 [Rhizobiales bacterium]|jgi:hypothetical protein|nr:hypothetical protein [Hyphomicrobiales bacterium]